MHDNSACPVRNPSVVINALGQIDSLKEFGKLSSR
jgi:hypothetical protein